MGGSISTDTKINETYQQMTFWHKIFFIIVHFVDQHLAWHKLPVICGLLYLAIRRTLHQNYNLKHVGPAISHDQSQQEIAPSFRTSIADSTDPRDNQSGDYGSFLGRNMMPGPPQTEKILEPHPSVVATKLLTRKKFTDTGKQFNMLAASWIQFMIHDWVDHKEATEKAEIVAPESVAAQCPLKSFWFLQTEKELSGSEDIKLGHRNMRTSWWDGSVIYGSNRVVSSTVRTFKDGKLKIGPDGLLEHHKDTGVVIAGDVKNSWAGVSILQALFIKEHNAVCDMLKKTHPKFDDEDLYQHARLVVAAVIAKIHTIDWTVELLKTKMLEKGMRANWYGLLGRWFKYHIGHTGYSVLSGYIGMKKPENHGVPYSLTEEFASVYRLHPLLPDEIILRNIHRADVAKKTPPVDGKSAMIDLVGVRGEANLKEIGSDRMLVSLGHQACGALVLYNYPEWARDLPQTDTDGVERPNHVDLAALEIFRDRERNVARYNDFRRNLLMHPIQKWEDLSDDPETVALLREIYGDNVESLDLLVGLLAEKKIEGFAISETSFFIFLLMASRRLEADKFFTTNFNAKVYTKEGLAWVNNTESLKDVLQRHHGDLVKNWLNARSAFSVWSG